MSRQFRATLGLLIGALWRRRHLLFTPVLILVPLSVALAVYLPGGFEARSLVLLQERPVPDPLARETRESSSVNSEYLQQLTASLQKLLVSDYVLAHPSGDLRHLQNRLSVALVGNELVEFRLSGDRSEGLGEQLERVMLRFAEALIVPTGSSIGEELLRMRREELARAEANHRELQRKVGKFQASDPTTDIAELRTMQARLQTAVAELKFMQNTRDHEEYEPKSIDGREETNPAGPPASAAQHQARLSKEAEVQQLTSVIKKRVQALRDSEEVEKSLADSEKALRALREAHTDFEKNIGVATRLPVLSVAPGRMMVLDPAKDPETRSKSRMFFLVSGVLGGLLLGLGLAVLAELLDTTIRYPHQLVTLTGLPVIASLPALSEADVGAERLASIQTPLVTRRNLYER